MKIIYSSIALYLFFAATVIAEIDHFISPGVNAQYSIGDTIPFLVDDMPDEDDLSINANLHKSDGSFVKTIQTWSSLDADENGEEFPFQWVCDVQEGGIYYVEIKVGTSSDEVTQSYPFTIISNNDPPTPQSDPVQEGNTMSNVVEYPSSIPESSDLPTASDPTQQVEVAPDPSTLETEPLKESAPGPSMEQLSAADDIAVAQEKASIAQAESPQKSTKHRDHKKNQKNRLHLDEILRHANAVDIANKVKAAAAINKAASIAHAASKQKRQAYSQIQRNRSKFSKWNL